MNMLHFEVGPDGVALIAIDPAVRPGQLGTAAFAAELGQAVERVLADAAVRGAVLTAAGSGLAAGMDHLGLLGLATGGITATDASVRHAAINRVLRRIETGGKPFAAAIQGAASGEGLEVCLACHRRFLVDQPKAVVNLPALAAGLIPAMGGTQRLPRLIGIEQALPLLLEGKPVAPAHALALGIVDAVTTAHELVAAARCWVAANPGAQQPWDHKGYRVPGGAGALAPHASRTFAAGMAGIVKTTQGNHPAPVALLSAVYEGTQLPLDLGLAIEAKYFGQLLSGPIARNLLRTLFVEKAAADALARRPAGVPKSRVASLGVLGAGMMGAGIAHVAAAAGIEVILLDATQEGAERGKRHTQALLDKDVERGRSTRGHADATLGRIRPTTDYADLAGCDFVIEAVFEERAVKAAVTQRAGAVVPGTAIFASNTSTLPITGLAQNFARPEQFIGVHFFSPVERMPLVEIILGAATAPATLARALDLVGQLRKTPIVVHDSPGFYTSRIFCSYIDEAMAMLEEGVAPALIENAARMAGMATGPLAVTDEVSLDLQQHVIDQARADGLPVRTLRAHAQRVIARMNALGRLGRKTGGGFHDFPPHGAKQLWPGLAGLYPPAAVQPAVGEVRNRLLYIQALESARCVEEGVITAAAGADLGAVLGLGFPSWTGGTLSFIDLVGLQPFVDECRRLAAHHGERFEPSPWLAERAARGAPFHPAAGAPDPQPAKD